MTEGINLGSGNWSFPKWKSIDKIKGERLDKKSKLEEEDDSLSYVYSCHFFEHVDDATAQNLFDESYRTLKPGGAMRIIVPDFEKIIQKYKQEDGNWFLNECGFRARPEWEIYGVKNNLCSIMLHILSNFDYKGPKGFYRGGPIGFSKEEIDDKLNTMKWQDFVEWAQSQHPKGDVSPQHINWWSLEKFQKMMSKFSKVERKKFSESAIPYVDSTNLFDKEKPGRRKFSMYIESIK